MTGVNWTFIMAPGEGLPPEVAYVLGALITASPAAHVCGRVPGTDRIALHGRSGHRLALPATLWLQRCTLRAGGTVEAWRR